jgi:hypothetical protein
MQSITALVMGGLRWIGLTLVNWISLALADEAPISGTIKTINPAAQTMTVQTTAKGRSREVTIVMKPSTRIVRFTHSTEPDKHYFAEQPATLNDLQSGWIVRVTTQPGGARGMAELVQVMLER